MRIATTLGLALTLAGCFGGNKNDSAAIQSVRGEDAAALNSTNARFESAEDAPFTASTRHAAGMLAESQNAQGRAIEQYSEAIRLDPKYQPSLYRLGVIYTQLKQYPRAIEVWKQYVRATNGAANAYSNLAFCYELAGQVGQAEEAYKSGIKRDPHNQPCRVNYGLMLVRLGKRDQGVEQLSLVLNPAEVHYNLASVHEQMGDTSTAKSEYEKALELDPQMWEAQQRLSKLD